MSAGEIDEYLRGCEEPKRSTLEALRKTILEVIPGAEQGISYGMPAFSLDGKVVAGFAAFKDHLSYLPHSGSVISRVGEAAAGFKHTAGSLHFPVDQPLPRPLVEKLVRAKLEEIQERSAARSARRAK